CVLYQQNFTGRFKVGQRPPKTSQKRQKATVKTLLHRFLAEMSAGRLHFFCPAFTLQVQGTSYFY
uniref:hypothetical protein n=1 Tax=Gemmiger formicilis TaxID=745368 RepID=UPI003FED7C58